jgi:hypothetical protein
MKRSNYVKCLNLISLTIITALPEPVTGNRNPPPQVQTHDSKTPTKANGAVEPKFEVILEGDGRTPDGIPTYFTSFRAPDGLIVYKTFIEFPSAGRSTKALEGLVKTSLKLVCHSTEVDEKGHQIGRRVLVLFASEEASKPPAAILAWTEGVKYYEVRSNSMDDLLAFEDATKRKQPNESK